MAFSTKDAAERMGINVARVRALIDAKVLVAEKIGGRWLVDEASVREQIHRINGRPYSAKRAWGLLSLASGRHAPWLSHSDRSKLRKRMNDSTIREMAPRLRTRAEHHLFSAHSSELKRLLKDRRLVLTGPNAAEHHGLDLIVNDYLDAYIKASNLQSLTAKYFLERQRQGNICLRVIGEPWPFEKNELFAPRLVVALDLFTSKDQRFQRAGANMLSEMSN